MNTEPQEPRRSITRAEYRQRLIDLHATPAAPVAQEPPAPSNAEWRKRVEELSPAALDACICYADEPCSVHPAPGSAQEPADPRLHDELCDYFAGEDCNCGTWQQEQADPPHEWTKAEVDALLAVPELREAIGKALRALVPVINSLKALGL